MSEEEKKIIVDEDWKSQVEAEKQQAAEAPEQPAAAAAYPPASFMTLVSQLMTEAMVALGQIPAPGAAEASLNLDHAKFVIDMLDMLQEKTAGNLDDGEAAALKDLLHQLKMAFVAIRQGPPPTEPGEGADEPKIVTP